MNHRNLKIAKIFGINIYLHYSWFFFAIFLSWVLATDVFPHYYPGWIKLEYWIVGTISSVLLFASVLFHELSHSVIAKKNKIKVNSITLFFFGGVAEVPEESMTPMKEFKVSIAGPLSSLFLAGLFWILLSITEIKYFNATFFYLARINLVLAIFNMVPGLPLDGGRVLRAILWGYYKNLKIATRYASNVGKFFALFLVFTGFFNIFAGNWGGLWALLIGLFLYNVSKLSYQATLIRIALEKIKASDVMSKRYTKIPTTISLEDAYKNYFLKYKLDSFPVVSKKQFLGIVNIFTLEEVPRKMWKKTKIKNILTKTKQTNPNAHAYDIFFKMLKEDLFLVPVLKNKKIVGIIRKDKLLQFISLKSKIEK